MEQVWEDMDGVGYLIVGSSEQRDAAADGGALQGDRFQGVGGSDREGREDGFYLTGKAEIYPE